jgi:hypothetical protein
MLDTDARKREYDGAMALLERVAAGTWTPEEPTTADTESAAGPSPSFTEHDRFFDTDSQDGI